jgi:hypothetical protein
MQKLAAAEKERLGYVPLELRAKYYVQRYSLTHELLLELLDYDPRDGVFIWKAREAKHFNPANKRDRDWTAKCWNNRRAGTEAGRLAGTGYVQITLGDVPFAGQRLAWFYVYKEWPPLGMQVDHINQVKADNRIANLRLATRSQNAFNVQARKDSTSGVKGVMPHAGRWQASIRAHGKRHHLGTFDTVEEAAEAYSKAAMSLHHEFSGV